ncbi:unnamed protein product [Triticum turgidum subsp. durum]|uniref:Wall-associated receptor kinase galacturonan-binding domain-containing protein n=1 Tax=Triticum turgidum subsp. durum TaxID=4567 RepID=A0A9R0R8L2_TRITD|nr:unnamed protein product [Triticum turgidum subsp. durum]
MAPSCWFFLALWLPLVLVVVAAVQQVEAGCSGLAKRCGNLTISDPLWVRNNFAERACGSSDFEVTCFNNTPVLRSSMPTGFGFGIVDISYEERRLHVADGGKLYLLQARNSCGIQIWNTSAKLGVPFSICAGHLNLILYNCTEKGAAAATARRDRELVRTRMRCGNDNVVFARVGGRYYDETRDYGGYPMEGCDTSAVPVMGSSSGKTNASDYEQLIADGFLLTWGPPPAPSPLPTPTPAPPPPPPPPGKLASQIIF